MMNKAIKTIIARLKKIKRYQYVLMAIFFHLVLIFITAHILVVAPFTSEVLFKGKIESRPKAPTQKKDIRPTRTIDTKVIKEVPVHIIKKAPTIEKRVMVKKEMKTPSFTRPPLDLTPKQLKPPKTQMEKTENILSREMAQRRTTQRQFAKQFKVSGRGRQIAATFTPILARYERGDWNKDPTALPNLMKEVNRRSNIKAEETPKIVSVSSEEIFKCPFVYFTGTRDFYLTEAEVQNLRKYLLQGGLVWADNGLPGRRSRFDIAFRREMKRVMPDRDFETIPLNHEIFSSFYSFDGVPSGMNCRDEPLEMIRIDKRLAVIYTLNDYGDFWETRFDENGKVDDSYDKNWSQRLWGPHWEQRGDLYENLNEETIEAAYELGLNIIVYLLTR